MPDIGKKPKRGGLSAKIIAEVQKIYQEKDQPVNNMKGGQNLGLGSGWGGKGR
jgi:hypothetical protein